MDELKQIIFDSKPHLIALTETWLTPDVSSSEIHIPGYSIIRSDSQSGRHGGVAMYLDDSLPPVSTLFCPLIPLIEMLWVTVPLRGTDCLILGCIYRSPSSPSSSDQALIEFLISLPTSSHILILGDLNAPKIDWSQSMCLVSGYQSELLDVICTRAWTQHISSPTRIREGHLPSLLDLIITNDEQSIDTVNYLPPLGKSDHVLLKFDYICYWNKVTNYVPSLNFKKANWDGLRKSLVCLADLDESNSVELMFTTLQSAIMNAVERHIPVHNCTPTLNPLPRYLRRRYYNSNNLFSYYKLTGLPEDWAAFRKARNLFKKEMRQFKLNKQKGVLLAARSHPLSLFKYMRSKRSAKPAAFTVKRSDGTPSSDPSESSNIFKIFFESTYADSSKTLYPLLPNRSFIKPLIVPIFSVDDVEKHLRSCNPNSSQGPDTIHPRVLAEAAKVLAVPVFKLFRCSLSTGELPSAWRQAHVIPIFKAGDRNQAGSYRPISLTSVLCKILERLLKRELLGHLLDNQLLSPAQHGFLPGHSCLTNLLLFLDNLTDAYDKGLTTSAIFFDFAKAFDKVPHTPLIQKLSAYGISGQFLNWISSFLNGRTFQVKLGSTLSDLAPVSSGVPQGSVLGPILFLIYVNDLPDAIKSNVLFYADDLKVWNSIDSSNLQRDVTSICDWSSVWNLPINPSKCLHMTFGKDRSHTFSLPSSNNSTSPIAQTDLTKDLGVWLSSNLSFSMHHATVAKQAFKVLHMIRRTFQHINAVDFAFLYGTYVRPILEYCNQVTFSGLVKDTNCLEKVQRAATKMVVGLKHISYNNRLKVLNLYPLETRRARGDLILAHSIFLKGNQSQYFHPHSNVNLRGHCLKLAKKHTRTRVRHNFFTSRVINHWNDLPEELVTAATRDSFKISLDTHLGLNVK